MTLASIPPASVAVARRPAQSGELEVWLSSRRCPVVALAGGPRTSFYEQAWLSGVGSRLAVVLLEESGSAQVTLSGAGVSGAQAGTAVVALPSWLGWAGPLRAGLAASVDAPEPFRSLTAVQASRRVAIVAVPDPEHLTHGGCVSQRDLTLGSEVLVASTGAPGQTRRRLPGGEMSVTLRPAESASRLASAGGGTPTAAVVRVSKEGVETERHLVCGWQPQLRISATDGEDEASAALGGPAEIIATFLAPGP